MPHPHPPILMLLCGKNPSHVTAVTEALRPEIEVIHTASSLSEALSFITNVKSSNIGLILMGGGFSPSDYETAIASSADAKSVPWLRPDVKHLAAFAGAGGPPSGGGPVNGGAGGSGEGPVRAPPAHVVAERARKCVDEHIEEIRKGEGAGKVWYF